jgi:hypothetical protein
MAGKVFISYRRDDSAGYAGRVHDRLEHEFGSGLLFMDVDSISLGADFVKVLRDEVAKCDLLLAIIGPSWLNAVDEDGHRRLENPYDFVRLEIAAALKRDIPVIPILISGARLPKSSELPADIADLTMRNGLEIRHASFHSDMNRLITRIKVPPPDTTRVEVARTSQDPESKNAMRPDASEAEEVRRSSSQNDGATSPRSVNVRPSAEPKQNSDEAPKANVAWGAGWRLLLVAILAAGFVTTAWYYQRQIRPTTITSVTQPSSAPDCDRQDVFDQTITGSIPGMNSYLQRCQSGPYTDRVRTALESQLYDSALDCINGVCSWEACLTSYTNYFPFGARLASLKSRGDARKNSPACGRR